MLKAIMFLLDHVIKHGDAPASAQAKRHKQMLEEESLPITSIEEFLPHQGSQSPQDKADGGLGGVGDSE